MRRFALLLALLATLCASLPAGAALARSAPNGAHGITPRPVRFPADTAAHDVPVEWWYFVGHLADARGRTYGFETTFFKFQGLRRYFPGSPEDTAYRTDVAVTDEAGRRFHATVTYASPRHGRTVASTSQLALRAAAMQVMTVGRLAYHIVGTAPGARVDLTVTSLRPPMLVHGGFQGWGTGYTYYYSLTHLRAQGTLTLGGRRIAVHGTAWHDHQWGNMGGSSVTGWDWMEMQLGDGTDLSLVNERPAVTLWARWTQALLPDDRQVYVPEALLTPLGSWRSPHTGIRYPSSWRVRVPRLGLDVVVRPTIQDQEVTDPFAVLGYRFSYWEGSCTVSGTHNGRHVTGKGYTELTGYGSLPQTPQL